VAVQGEYAYIADECGGMEVADVSDPYHPAGIAHHDPAGFYKNVTIAGNFIYFSGLTNGIVIYDVTNPAAPRQASHCLIGCEAKSTSIIGNICYISTIQKGLILLNVTNPYQPVEIPFAGSGGVFSRVFLNGHYVYGYLSSNGMRIIDISDVNNPQIAASFRHSLGLRNMRFAGDYAYMACYNNGFKIMNVSNPLQPNLISTSYDTCYINDVRIADIFAFLAYRVSSYNGGLIVMDIDRPGNPITVSILTIANLDPYSLAMDGHLIYLAGDNSGPSLYVIDVSNPANPVILESVGSEYNGRQVEILGDYAYMLNTGGDIVVYNKHNPRHLELVNTIAMPGNPDHFTAKDHFLYIADYANGLRILDVSNPGLPVECGYYDTTSQLLDVAVQGQYAFTGSYDWFNILDCTEAITPNPGTSGGENNAISLQPSEFSLNLSPNPFNPQTLVEFTLPEAGDVSLKVFDTLGREVQALESGGWGLGKHTVVWDAGDLPSGIYFIRLESGGEVRTVKGLLVK